MENKLTEFTRTKSLFGHENFEKIQNAHVAVFGIGGVGGYVVEALVRSGIQKIDIIDNDTVSLTNINRQIIATHSTIGKYKVDVMKARILDINPNAHVNCFKCFYLPEKASEFDFGAYDYVVDAVDNVTAKIDIICNARAAGVPVISSMGTGNKLDPTMFKIADIEKTRVCPLAKVVRKELRKRGVFGVKVLYSEEEPRKPLSDDTRTPASISFVPSAAGLIIAGRVILDILEM